MKVRKGSLSQTVLLVLEKSVDGIVKLDDMINNPGFYAYGEGRDLPKSILSQALKRLRERGLIDTTVGSEETVLKLTKLGREALDLEVVATKEWDGRWRIVIFDIPESHKRLRDSFRKKLKIWDFKILQHSVWISKQDITFKLRKLISELGLQNWVLVIESDDPVLKNTNSAAAT